MTAYTVTPEQKAAIAEKLIHDAFWRIGGYTLHRRDEMCDWLCAHAEIVTTFLEGRTGAGSEPPSAAGKRRVGIEGAGADRRSDAGVPEPNDTPHSTSDAASALQYRCVAIVRVGSHSSETVWITNNIDNPRLAEGEHDLYVREVAP